MNLALSYDWGDYSTARPSTYTQESKGAPTAYGGRNIRYGAANMIYGGSEKPIMETDVQGFGILRKGDVCDRWNIRSFFHSRFGYRIFRSGRR